MSNPDQTIQLTTHQLHMARAMAGDMRPPLSAPGRPRCALFLTMVEQFEAALLLARAGLASHGAAHVRGMLESLVAFRILKKGIEHIDQMRFEQLRGEKRLYERVLKLSELSDAHRADIESSLEACKAEYQPLFDRSVRPSRIIDQFEIAGIAGLAAPYIMLCSFAHSDLAALALRHQGDHGMTLRAGDTDEIRFLVLSIAHFAIVDAAADLGSIAKFPEGAFEGHYQTMLQTYENLMGLKG